MILERLFHGKRPVGNFDPSFSVENSYAAFQGVVELLEKALHDKYGLVRRPAWRVIEKLKEA
jgi:hypothetical protein